MTRREMCEKARHEAWDKAKDVKDRITRLKKIVSQYPENMISYTDIAVSYLKIDVDKANQKYQKIIDLKDTFEHVWDDELGKVYLFTENYEKAIETLENSSVVCYDQGLFLAFAYLKNGDKKKFEQQFDKWVSEDLEKSFECSSYSKYIDSLFNKPETEYIEKTWEKYHEKYSNMTPYQLYCKIYKQRFIDSGITAEDFDDEDFELPPKLSRSKFERLMAEYNSLDRRTMFGEASEEEYERYFELEELLFAKITIG